MIIMFTLTHTPLSIINFATSKSRNSYETGTQFTAGIIRVIYMFARILWHAQIEGNKMYKKVDTLASYDWLKSYYNEYDWLKSKL